MVARRTKSTMPTEMKRLKNDNGKTKKVPLELRKLADTNISGLKDGAPSTVPGVGRVLDTSESEDEEEEEEEEGVTMDDNKTAKEQYLKKAGDGDESDEFYVGTTNYIKVVDAIRNIKKNHRRNAQKKKKKNTKRNETNTTL